MPRTSSSPRNSASTCCSKRVPPPPVAVGLDANSCLLIGYRHIAQCAGVHALRAFCLFSPARGGGSNGGGRVWTLDFRSQARLSFRSSSAIPVRFTLSRLDPLVVPAAPRGVAAGSSGRRDRLPGRSARSVQGNPSLLQSPHRPLRSADELVGEAGRFREPMTDGAGKDPPSRKATQGWHDLLRGAQVDQVTDTDEDRAALRTCSSRVR